MNKHLVATLVGLAASAGAIASTACALPDAQPVVTIGHLATSVPNLDVDGTGPGTCTINDLIAEEGAHADQAAWRAHVQAVLAGLPTGLLTPEQQAEIFAKAREYRIGRFARIKIIGINDFHGQLRSPGLQFGQPAGGVDMLAGYVEALRAKNPRANIFVSAGDLIGATPLVSGLFYDEPTIEAMNRMGLDVNVVGNHEFDEGRAEVLRMANGGCHPTDTANSCKGAVVGTPVPFEGARFDFLSANVRSTDTSRTLFPAFVIREIDGIRVGFVGAVLEDTPSVVTPTGVAGLKFRDEADAINERVAQMRARGAETIVALIHQGGQQALAPANEAQANGCVGISGPIVDIVNRLDPAIDLVLTAHTHRYYNCLLPNASGGTVRVTQGDSIGRGITEVDITVDRRTKDAVGVAAWNRSVRRNNPLITPVAAIDTLVAQYEAVAAPIAGSVIGQITASVCRNATDHPTCAGAAFPDGVNQAGALIADAQLSYTSRAGFGDAVVAFMNPGGVRASFAFPQSGSEGDGNVTYAESFAVQPFGNSLVTMTLTGAQIEQLLEQQFMGCPNAQPFNRILQPSAGFTYQWNAIGPACDKVDPASIRINGVPVDAAAAYRVTVNSFMADGGDSLTVLVQGTNRLGGAQDLDALTRYLGLNQPYTPVDFAVQANKRAVRLN